MGVVRLSEVRERERTEVVEGVHDKVERLEVLDAVLLVLRARRAGVSMRLSTSTTRESVRALILRCRAVMLTCGLNLRAVSRATWRRRGSALCAARAGRAREGTHDGLWSLDVLLLEEELAVEVREVDRVEVEDLDLAALAAAVARHDCEGECVSKMLLRAREREKRTDPCS